MDQGTLQITLQTIGDLWLILAFTVIIASGIDTWKTWRGTCNK